MFSEKTFGGATLIAATALVAYLGVSALYELHVVLEVATKVTLLTLAFKALLATLLGSLAALISMFTVWLNEPKRGYEGLLWVMGFLFLATTTSSYAFISALNDVSDMASPATSPASEESTVFIAVAGVTVLLQAISFFAFSVSAWVRHEEAQEACTSGSGCLQPSRKPAAKKS